MDLPKWYFFTAILSVQKLGIILEKYWIYERAQIWWRDVIWVKNNLVIYQN